MHKKQPKGETFFSPRLQRLASFLREAHLVFPEVEREKINADDRKCANTQSFSLFSNSRVVIRHFLAVIFREDNGSMNAEIWEG